MRDKQTPLLTLLFLLAALTLSAESTAVEIRSYDGFALQARYFTDGEVGPGVLLLHQCDRGEGKPTGYAPLIEALQSKGFNVLELDSRGYGGSVSAEFNTSTWKRSGSFAPQDTKKALDFLLSRREGAEQPVVLIGASCGGRRAVRVAVERDEVKAFVFLSAAIGSADRGTLDALGVPLFCITSRNDPNGLTTESMRSVYERSKSDASRLEIFEGNLHGTPLLVQEPDLGKTIAKWAKDIVR